MLTGGDPYACELDELDDLTADRARYDEAAVLYEDVTRQIEDLLAAKEPMTDALASKLTGHFLERTTNTLADNAESSGSIRGHTETVWVRPVDLSDAGSTLALEKCSVAGTLIASPAADRPNAALVHVFLTEVDGEL